MMTEPSKRSWRSPPRSSPSKAHRPTGNDPLIHKEHAAVAAAVATAIGGLLAWLIGWAVQLDGRLDRLEQGARLLIDPSGKIIPAQESVEAKHLSTHLHHELDILRERVVRLEDKQ